MTTSRRGWFQPLRYDPWAHLGQMQGQLRVTLLWHDDGNMGETNFDNRTVSLRRGMTVAQRRSTLAHELVHVDRGPVPAGTTPCEEVLADLTAAQRMISPSIIRDLPELVDKHGQSAAQDFLEIDREMLESALRLIKMSRADGWEWNDDRRGQNQAARP